MRPSDSLTPSLLRLNELEAADGEEDEELEESQIGLLEALSVLEVEDFPRSGPFIARRGTSKGFKSLIGGLGARWPARFQV